MKMRTDVGPGALLGLVLLGGSIVPASAQTANNSPRPSHVPPGQSYVVPLPPYQPQTQAEELLLRDFMRMRATAPNPDKFLYGRYNPRFQVVTPRPVVPFPVYPYPYPGYYYGAPVLPNPYLGIQYGYGGRLPLQSQQQEVIILREGNNGQAQQPAPQQQREAARPAEPRTGSLREDFYLGGKGKSEALPDVVDDIRKAWLNGDYERLQARFKPEGTIGIYPEGKFKYAVSAKEFLNVAKEAMTRFDTVSFDLERPKSLQDGRVFIGGKHVFLDADKKRQETQISYVLERTGGRWYIVEAGSDEAPITKHEK